MKRHPALQDLSRDHRDVLVHARRLEAGHGDAAGFLRFWDVELGPHLDEEDAVLAPALAGRDAALDAALDRVRADHAWLRARAEAVRAGEGAALAEVGARLREHVRMEERELFAHAQAILPEDELAALAARLTAHRLAARGPGAVGPDRGCAV